LHGVVNPRRIDGKDGAARRMNQLAVVPAVSGGRSVATAGATSRAARSRHGRGPAWPTRQQPGWPQPGYGTPPTEGMAVAALVVAIVGFLVCAPVGAIVALVLANGATQRIQASGGRLSGLEQARAARVIAIIELVLTRHHRAGPGDRLHRRGQHPAGEEEGVPVTMSAPRIF
jgi:hypothetical protein